jgi:hypothetical protein
MDFFLRAQFGYKLPVIFSSHVGLITGASPQFVLSRVMMECPGIGDLGKRLVLV